MVEDFSMCFFATKQICFFSVESFHEINLKKKFLESLDNFLSKSEKIRKITINSYLSAEYVTFLADLILKHAKPGKIEYFAGYNLKMLMENKVEILELGKKDKLFQSRHNIEIIISEILRKLLVHDNKIIKIIEYNKPKNVTNVKEFMQKVTESKNFVLNSKNSTQGLNLLSSLHYYSIIILSAKIKEIIVFDISNIDLKLYIKVFPELLKEFKSIEKFRLIL